MTRPIGVTVVSILMCLGAGLLALGSLAYFTLGKTTVTFGNEGPMSALFARMGAFGGGLFLALAIIYVTLAICLWELRALARTTSIAFIGLGQLFALLGILRSLPHPHPGVLAWQIFVVLTDVGILWYLSTARIVKIFSSEASTKAGVGAVVKAG